MIDIKTLITILKAVSFLGLIVTFVMIYAITYKKLNEHYPDQIKKHKWIFAVLGIVTAYLLVFVYKKFILNY